MIAVHGDKNGVQGCSGVGWNHGSAKGPCCKTSPSTGGHVEVVKVRIASGMAGSCHAGALNGKGRPGQQAHGPAMGAR